MHVSSPPTPLAILLSFAIRNLMFGLGGMMDKLIPIFNCYICFRWSWYYPHLFSVSGYGYVIQAWPKQYTLFHKSCDLTQCGPMRVSAQIFVQTSDSEFPSCWACQCKDVGLDYCQPSCYEVGSNNMKEGRTESGREIRSW